MLPHPFYVLLHAMLRLLQLRILLRMLRKLLQMLYQLFQPMLPMLSIVLMVPVHRHQARKTAATLHERRKKDGTVYRFGLFAQKNARESFLQLAQQQSPRTSQAI